MDVVVVPNSVGGGPDGMMDVYVEVVTCLGRVEKKLGGVGGRDGGRDGGCIRML